jgi:hypothetical protein
LLSFPGLIAAALMAKAYWTCRGRIADPDLGFHLLNGQYILAHHRFPIIDTYSYTAAGTVWLDHAWLPEVLYYLAYHVLGLRGIFLVLAASAVVLYLGIYLLCRKESDDPLAAGIATILGGLLAMVTFTPRTQNIGWLCFLAVYAILLRFRATRRAPLWLIPPVFCIWINCHGTWPFGFIVFGVIVAAGWIRRNLGPLQAAPWSETGRRKLLAVFAASVAALFLNPFGWRLVLLPVRVVFRQQMGITFIEEYASINFNDSRGIYMMIVLGLLYAMVMVPRRPWRIDDVVLTAFVLYLGLTHVRFLILAGIVLPPILAPQLGRISAYKPAHERRALNAALLAVVLAVFVWGFPSGRYLEAQMEDFFPAGAVNYLAAHPQQGNMFNSYNWGGYLEWKLPQAPTFIDSRDDIFEFQGVFKDYLDIIDLNRSQELLDRYQVSYLLYPADAPLSYFLSKGPSWECIYHDRQAVIYRRHPATGR